MTVAVNAIAPAVAATIAKAAPVTVRLVQPKDLEQLDSIHKLINAAYRAEGGWTTESHLVKEERITPSQLSQVMQDPINPLMLAFDPLTHEPLGTIQIEPAEYYPDFGTYTKQGYTCDYQEPLPKEKQILLGLFSVSPTQQARGIGRQLVNKALEHAKEKMGRTQAVVYVIQQREELISWYRRLGFVDFGEKINFPDESLLLDEEIHFCVMRKPL